MSPHPFSRFNVLATSFVALYFGFVACGSDDGSKRAMDDGSAGEGGAAGGEAPSSGGSQVKAGNGGGGTGGVSQGGNSATTTDGGAAGAPEPGGASAGGMTTNMAGQTGVAGSPSENGGAAGEAGAAGAGGSGDVVCDPPSTLGSRITIAFDTTNAERVTNLQWLDSSNATTANVAASGGPVVCGDPQEFFGASYGAAEGSTPYPVIQGSRSAALACASDVTITSAPTNCNDQPQIPTTTQYHLYDGAKASQMRVTRTLGFDANSPQYSGIGVRVWESRVPLSVLPKVIIPDDKGATTTVNALSCGGDCFTPVGATWNGKWFAKTGDSGLAMIVVRDPSVTSPVDLTVNYDSYSNANIASFVVLQPQGGWKAPITEIEYVCFADLTSWPQTDRDAAKLPAGCGP